MWGFISDERGFTAIEYSLIAGLVAAVVMVGMAQVGQALGLMSETVRESLLEHSAGNQQ